MGLLLRLLLLLLRLQLLLRRLLGLLLLLRLQLLGLWDLLGPGRLQGPRAQWRWRLLLGVLLLYLRHPTVEAVPRISLQRLAQHRRQLRWRAWRR